MPEPICPECRNGKHPNCDGWAIDDNDEIAVCSCCGTKR